MKKIINGFRYDTDKAILVGSYSTPVSRSDFNYWEASLYKTPRLGKFFIVGEGHGMTRFASHNGNTSSWGSKLIPMEREEALGWAEQYLDVEAIEEHFSDMVKDA